MKIPETQGLQRVMKSTSRAKRGSYEYGGFVAPAMQPHQSISARVCPCSLSQGKSRNEVMRLKYKAENGNDGDDGEPSEDGNRDDDERNNDDLEDAFEERMVDLANRLGNNPIARIFTNSYTFFWNFPKKSLPFDTPWVAFKNSSAEFISWYQFPHNLPPYRYVGEGYRDDMFCYGLEGNTLPLGNWDPFGFQLVDQNMMRKYRESELKHGRLAMLACVGFILQEFYHPMHENIGGMAITHMAQLQHLASEKSTFNLIIAPLLSILPQTLGSVVPFDSQILIEGSANSYPHLSVDYLLLVAILSSLEFTALLQNWTRWEANEYHHQFEHNMGVGNLKGNYRNGDYNFDVLGLMPKGRRSRRRAVEKELNHCRLAMIAIIGMIGQEYLTGISVKETILNIFNGSGELISSTDSPSLLENFINLPRFIQSKIAESGFMSSDRPLPK